jgi:hypothetical protein
MRTAEGGRCRVPFAGFPRLTLGVTHAGRRKWGDWEFWGIWASSGLALALLGYGRRCTRHPSPRDEIG